jgi:lactoylglutathione lyase
MTSPALTLVVIRANDIDKLATFYTTLGLQFTKHRHGKGPEHLSSTVGQTVFEIYPASTPNETTNSTRLGFTVPDLTQTLNQLRELGSTILTEPSQTEFGRRAVLKDFEGHKIELYEAFGK